MSRPLLSILIPSKNRGAYLCSAIKSALAIGERDIEIIVSDNFSSDDSFQIAQSFSDNRLKLVRPTHPLPMHEHWEFLLGFATGEWITFIGDDDGVMPHAARYLRYIDSNYPGIEALVTPRAYFFWESAYQLGDKAYCQFVMSNRECILDSKKQFQRCLRDEIDYLVLPQLYSGGFQRRSLIKRVIQSQGGHYFRSVTPDAYSALMGVLHTYRYLEVGMPLTWIGTSPSHSYNGKIRCAKNHQKDFVDMYKDAPITMNRCLGERSSWWPFGIYFYESYLSAAPFVSLADLSFDKIQYLSDRWSQKLISKGLSVEAAILAKQLGVRPLPQEKNGFATVSRKVIRVISKKYFSRVKSLLSRILLLLLGQGANYSSNPAIFYSSLNTDVAIKTIADANLIVSRFFVDCFKPSNEEVNGGN